MSEQKSLIRGSTDLHISPEGKIQAYKLSHLFSGKNVPAKIFTSTQNRALETAHIIFEGCKPSPEFHLEQDLESWHLGGYEGKEKEKVLKEIQSLVAARPWAIPAGMGEKSTKPGESFLAFRTRVLRVIRDILEQKKKDKNSIYSVVTHFHDIRMILAWLAKNGGRPGPQDVSYDPKVYNVDTGEPCDVYMLSEKNGELKCEKINIESFMGKLLPREIYLIRHAKTEWNK